jgi:hypothetical protein
MKARIAVMLFASLLVLGGAGGCGHMATHEALLHEPGSAHAGAVELYLADQPVPERPFTEIALVQAVGFGSQARPEDVARALTERAGSLGCDAVVRAFIDQGYSRAHASGVCVKWLGPGPAAPAPLLPPDPGSNPARPTLRPAPAPRLEPLPSAGPSQGGGR